MSLNLAATGMGGGGGVSAGHSALLGNQQASMPGSGTLQGFTGFTQQQFDPMAYLESLNAFNPGIMDALNATVMGDNLHGNPYLDQAFQTASGGVTDAFNNSVLPNIASQFGGAGRTGGGLHHNAVSDSAGGLTDSLAQLSNQMYGTNYQMERDRQLGAASGLMDIYNQGAGMDLQRLGLGTDLFNQSQNRLNQLNMNQSNNSTQQAIANQQDAFNRLRQSQGHALDSARLGTDIYGMQLGQQTNMMNMLPTLLGMGQQSNLQGIEGMLQAGGLLEGYGQNAIDDQVARWNFDQMAPWDALGRYGSLIGGNYGTTGTVDSSGTSTGTNTSRQRNSPFSTILGGGMALGGLGWNPFGGG